MKVRIILTVEVDPELWSAEYGVLLDEAAIRADVRAYVLNQILASPAAEAGALA